MLPRLEASVVDFAFEAEISWVSYKPKFADLVLASDLTQSTACRFFHGWRYSKPARFSFLGPPSASEMIHDPLYLTCRANSRCAFRLHLLSKLHLKHSQGHDFSLLPPHAWHSVIH